MADRTAKRDRLEALLGPALDGHLSDAEAHELRELLAGDPEAQRYYLRRFQLDAMLTEEESILGLFDGLEDGAEPDNLIQLPVGSSSERGANRPGGAADAGRVSGASASDVTSRLRRFARPLVIGAAGLAAGLVAAVWIGRVGSPGSSIAPAANRGVELVREAELSDGSTVELAPKSTVALRYTEGERALELQDGEAHFSVAPDPARPFVVVVGSVRVRAVGTAFNVRRAGERVVVTVTEGKVEVSESASPAVTSPSETARKAVPSVDTVIVAAGSQVLWDREEASDGPVLSSVNVSQTLAWREGRLTYSHEPLRAVVADLNRYSDRPITIDDPELERLQVTGTVLTRATGAWLASLPNSLPVRVSVEDGRYVIRAQGPDGTTG